LTSCKISRMLTFTLHKASWSLAMCQWPLFLFRRFLLRVCLACCNLLYKTYTRNSLKWAEIWPQISLLLWSNALNPYGSAYVVRQFNSRNVPVKTKFVYLCTSGCCRLRNTLLVKLNTSWDNGGLENRFPEYLEITFSRYVGCQKCQQIFVPSGYFFNFGKSQKSQGAKSGGTGGWSIFVTQFLSRNSRTLNTSCAGALSL